MAANRTSVLAEEVRQWNTPLVGGYLLWQFTLGYCQNHKNGDAPTGVLHFIAIAILTSTQLNETVSDRRKNLQSYVNGFEDLKRTDLLISIQDRIAARKQYTLSALNSAIAAGLLVWDVESGKIYPQTITKKTSRGKSLRQQMVKEGKRAAILGKWFSEHDTPTIASYLRVVL